MVGNRLVMMNLGSWRRVWLQWLVIVDSRPCVGSTMMKSIEMQQDSPSAVLVGMHAVACLNHERLDTVCTFSFYSSRSTVLSTFDRPGLHAQAWMPVRIDFVFYASLKDQL